MKNKKVISVLVIVIATMAVIAASSGIFSHGGNGLYEYQSIRGKPVTLVLLPLLMTALTAKIIAMAMTGVNVIPAVFIIPAILIISIICSLLLLRNINEHYTESS